MGHTLAHRGPDNFGLFREGNFGCAHNRLSILDLSEAGNQPFSDDRYVLAYNGEIYNWKEMRTELEAEGVAFRSTSDTEALFYYLARFGTARTLRKARGMFAFSWYDRHQEVLHLCRDRFAIKPLYWTFVDGALYWSSEVKALAAVVQLELDPVLTIFSAASIGDHSLRTTLFRGVEHVPPASYLVGSPGQRPAAALSYYDIAEDVEESTFRELESMKRASIRALFSELLDRSVEGMLMSDAPIGAFVSGGIDSSLIAALAAQKLGEISLFTSNVVGAFSEVEDARKLAEGIGCRLFEQRFTPELFLQHWVSATVHQETPIVSHTNAVPFSLVAQLARDTGVKAVLTGEGSDELFLGYPRLLTERFRRLAAAPVNLLKSVYSLLPGLREYLFPQPSESIDGFLGVLAQRFERQRLREEGRRSYDFLPARQAQQQYLTIQMMREGLVGLLHRNDRMGMASSIEARFPFLDEEVVRFAINLPVKWKIGRSHRFHNYKHPFLIDKAVVRDTARGRLPRSLIDKKKDGFPMYGHRFVRVEPQFFSQGYLARSVGLDEAVAKHLVLNEDSYFVAKLVSVDIFGRLFEGRESVDDITARLLRHVHLDVPSSAQV